MERKENPSKNNSGFSFPIRAGLWNYNKYGNKTQMIVQFGEPFFHRTMLLSNNPRKELVLLSDYSMFYFQS